MKRIALSMTAVLILLASSGAGAATARPGPTPTTGVFRGVTSQKDPHLAIYVARGHGGHLRVEGVALGFTMDCEDGSSVSRTAYLGGASVTGSGRFRIAGTSGGNYGPHGSIRLTVRFKGRFTSKSSAQGTFDAGALIAESTTSPAVACSTGAIGWVAAR